jgi:hypothetical protein
MPFIIWVVWLVFQCVRRRKRAVIVCQVGGIGDVVWILPMCSTAANCDQLVDLGEMTDAVKSVMACVEWRTKLRIYVDDLTLSPVTI